jgi:twinkle protein
MSDLKTKDTNDFLYHEPCPNCKSKDNLARYSDNSAYCFGCEYSEQSKDGNIIPTIVKKGNLLDGKFNALIKRKISEETCRKYNYQVGKHNGKTVHIANHYDKENKVVAQQVRYPNKDFKWIGEPKNIQLFGQHVWKGGGKMLVVTEGQIDCLTISQYCFNNRFAVCSIPSGVKSAPKHIANNIDWIEKFDSVIFCFDMDEQGREASVQCAKLLSPSKAKITSLMLKDANEMVLKGKTKELIDSVWQAKVWRPDGIVGANELWEEVFKPDEFPAMDFPFDGLQKASRGIRLQSLITLCAGSGIGKSTVTKEIAYHLLQRDQTVGIIALEESVKESLRAILGVAVSEKLNDEEIRKNVSEEKVKKVYDEINERLYFFDHFGSLDGNDILNNIRYLARACNCKYIILDHITMVISGLDGDDRKNLDTVVTKLRSLCQELDITVIMVSHLKRLEGNRDHVDGVQVSLGHLRGSGSLGHLSDLCLAFERNTGGDNPNLMNVRILKNRFNGVTGVVDYLEYDNETGRLFNATRNGAESGRQSDF